MKYALVAVVATTIGLGAALPAIAQDAGASQPPAATAPAPDGTTDQSRPDQPGRNHFRLELRGTGMNKAGGLMKLACSPKAAEELDVALLRLSYRLQLTDTQKPLFEAFRSKALTEATNFADTCEAARPDKSAGRPDLLARIKSTLAIDTARLGALEAVLPDFEALYNSLTDVQKKAITPRGGFGFGGFGTDNTDRSGAPGRIERPQAPGRG